MPCVYGDVSYPLAEVDFQVGVQHKKVEAGIVGALIRLEQMFSN